MQQDDNLSEIKVDGQKIIDNVELNIWEALIPVIILMGLLAYNIFFADGAWLGDYSNQYILLMGGGVAAIVGFFNKVSIGRMLTEIWENLKSRCACRDLVGKWRYSCDGLLWPTSIKP